VTVRVTNVSRGTCRLALDSLVGTVGGVDTPLITNPVPPPGRTTLEGAVGVAIRSGETAYSQLAPAAGCSGVALTYPQVHFTDGLSIPGLTLTVTCGVVDLSLWYVPGRAPATGLGGLAVRIDAPAIVEAGSDFWYVVTLTNPTGANIAFDPCPVYTESLGTEPAAYLLNCVFSAIPAGSWIRLMMRMSVPASASLGQTTLVWSVVGADGSAVTDGAIIQIE
jgi:hypothetical protein